MSQELYQQIPGLKQAVEREQAVREQSYLDFNESICGIEVKPLTLRKMLLLSAAGSPFVVGGAVTPYHVGAFFLTMTDAKGWSRWRLLRRIGLINGAKVIEAIQAFMDETYQDAPPSSRGESVSYYSFASGLVDCFAAEYGWTRDGVLDSPLKCLFQELKAIVKRNNPKAIQFNPSDRVRGNWLKEQNALTGRN